MTDQETFEQAMLRSWSEESGGKSFVLFASPSCPPCGRVKATLEALEGTAGAQVSYVNVYHAVAAAVQSSVRSVPTLIKFAQGEEVARMMGDQGEAAIRAFIDA